ncbi:MAG: response regulator [Propionibacteriaceae bacterium]|jgi:CheY-like chemotaxis protein|nr:response regulator [Propionibacteriaceae bacterium]
MTESIARILVYSDERAVREAVRAALGKSIAADLPEVEVVEAATQPAALQFMDSGAIDLAILDGEATPAGGMGLAHQLKDDYPVCPPVLLLVARVADAWLATWSQADATLTHPVDPVLLPLKAAELLRAWFAETPETAEASA